MVTYFHDGVQYRVYVYRLDMRRAMFRVLLDEGRPVPISTIVDRLRAEGWTERDFGGAANKVVSDLLRHQVRKGIVERTARGVYKLRVDRLSRSTIWRIRNSEWCRGQ